MYKRKPITRISIYEYIETLFVSELQIKLPQNNLQKYDS